MSFENLYRNVKIFTKCNKTDLYYIFQSKLSYWLLLINCVLFILFLCCCCVMILYFLYGTNMSNIQSYSKSLIPVTFFLLFNVSGKKFFFLCCDCTKMFWKSWFEAWIIKMSFWSHWTCNNEKLCTCVK